MNTRVAKTLASGGSKAAKATRAGQGIEQRTLADFIQRGHYTTHLRLMRARYAARQAALRAALDVAFGTRFELSGGEAGLHLVLWLPSELPDVDVARRAALMGLGLRALSAYATPPVTCNGLVLGYGNLDEEIVTEAVRRLKLTLGG